MSLIFESYGKLCFKNVKCELRFFMKMYKINLNIVMAL